MPRGIPNKPAQVPGQTPVVATETKVYDDGVTATGPAPLPEVSPVKAPAAAGGLPHPDDFDPKTLKGPVLTSQGWLCPDDSDKPQRK